MEAIKAENLSKLYHLGESAPNSLRDLVTGLFRRGSVRRKSDLWALRDVSFSVADGETLGIIGRNGAGKSTLLKILSRITKPTRGRAEIRGRVGSLLEVGTGFHGELSGRENIYLNGAILGMKRFEIEKKFDEIVDFIEVEEFLDTPVKHYSSGMYMRLAFAVAAHLEPEVLIVDEVLAVGDTGFQNKCLGKMDEVSRSGRTVLFVSHNLGSLARICKTGILLDRGEMVYHGEIREAIERYIKLSGAGGEFHVEDAGSADIAITSAALLDAGSAPTGEVVHDQPFAVALRGSVRRHRRGAMFCVALLNKYKRRVFTEHKTVEELLNGRTGDFDVRFSVPGNFIAPNNYSFLLQIFTPDGEVLQELNDVCPFEVVDAGSDMVGYRDFGYVVAKGEWRVCGK
jgi:lipopolysaccharide transport system ATP-binding protein